MSENGGLVRSGQSRGCLFRPVSCWHHLRTAALDCIYHPRIPRLAQFAVENERLGITSALQWKPRAGTEVSLDLLYSRHEGLRQENLLTPIGLFRAHSQQGKPETIVRRRKFAATIWCMRVSTTSIYAPRTPSSTSTPYSSRPASPSSRSSTIAGARAAAVGRLRLGLRGAARDNAAEWIGSTRMVSSTTFAIAETRPRIVWGFDTTDPEQLLLRSGSAGLHRWFDRP